MKLDPDRFEWVGKKFLELANNPDNYLSFHAGSVYSFPCRTVACHAGWCCVIFNLKTHDYYWDFMKGAHALAEYLGFENSNHYKVWASETPEIWLNINGSFMFSAVGYMAFGVEHAYLCDLNVIGNHYIAVAKRIREIQIERMNK